MISVCVAFKAHQGWINAVAIDADKQNPLPLNVRRLELSVGADRELSEPYHVAGGWQGLERIPRPGNPESVVRRGRRKQAARARIELASYREELKQIGLAWIRAVVLTGRGRHGADLEHILASHTQIHVAEGEAIRDACRAALTALNIDQVDHDEKSVLPEASTRLRLTGSACDDYLKTLKPPGASNWTKEERTIALAAWLNIGVGVKCRSK